MIEDIKKSAGERMRKSVDALKEELEVFADAIQGYAPFPVSGEDMLATVAAFEAVVKALESDRIVELA